MLGASDPMQVLQPRNSDISDMSQTFQIGKKPKQTHCEHQNLYDPIIPIGTKSVNPVGFHSL